MNFDITYKESKIYLYNNMMLITCNNTKYSEAKNKKGIGLFSMSNRGGTVWS